LAEKDTVVVGCQRFDSDFTGEGQRQQWEYRKWMCI
jgi:hypothetical protein